LSVPKASNPFDRAGQAHADADAQGRKPVSAAAAFELMDERHREARARHAERMAERDGTAIGIDLRRIVLAGPVFSPP
jgi:hypothetical protein